MLLDDASCNRSEYRKILVQIPVLEASPKGLGDWREFNDNGEDAHPPVVLVFDVIADLPVERGYAPPKPDEINQGDLTVLIVDEPWLYGRLSKRDFEMLEQDLPLFRLEPITFGKYFVDWPWRHNQSSSSDLLVGKVCCQYADEDRY
jgi:hypothetical protein